MNGYVWTRISWRVVAVALCVLLAVSAAGAAEGAKGKGKKPAAAPKAAEAEAAAHPSTMPWHLRAYYRVGLGDWRFLYSMDNGEWTLQRGEDTIIDNVGMTITLADGSVVDIRQGEKEHTSFGRVESELGMRQQYWVDLVPMNGLQVTHNLDLMLTRPVILFRASIRNVSDKPIRIARVAPAVFEPKGITGLGAQVSVAQDRAVPKGAHLLYDPAQPVKMTLFHDPTRKFILALGGLSGAGKTTDVALSQDGTAWKGRIETRYEPAVTLNPGETLETEPVWLSYVKDAASMEDANAGAMPESAAPKAEAAAAERPPVKEKREGRGFWRRKR
jgi:hypothetical protein